MPASTAAAATRSIIASNSQPKPAEHTSTASHSSFGIRYPAIAADRRTPAVLSLLDGYFAAVNRHDWASAVGAFDPAGVVDNTDLAAVARFASDISSIFDDFVVLHSIGSDPAQPGGVLVLATFRSRQAPALGPAGQSCTNWRLTYELTQWGSGFRILRGLHTTYTAC